MPEFYLIIVVLLFVLAISDLVVGVSNDAVNFLNSAIGSKVAPRHIIMIVASLGIFVGATFSSGMMEVARKGVFNPEFFMFGEIMIIFLAVMLTDIILLDFFNTVGLPTSTTVSIVFELLGAAVAMAIIKMAANYEGIATLNKYINSSQAILIISGIFLSVLFAFLIGALVQFISRLIFTFRYHKRANLAGAIWAGAAMTAMTYFLLLKGIKGASFASGDLVSSINEHMLPVTLGAFGVWTIVMLILGVRKVNIFRVVVLFGTFALAMAFAGNDLVNFIGVPIAGFESYLAWKGTGQDAFAYSMEVLQEPVRTKSYLLVLAGLIMIVTLWFSKKARSVTDTEVSLGRQDEGHERFYPSSLSRGIVRYTLAAGSITQRILPKAWLRKADENFDPLPDQEGDKPAFDLVRASVNLTMASTLIAFATSLKLPLSTTYVSFMVAMGTSLADRAWGRDSAVYRVAGVLNVIGGWFATAIIAFMVAAIFATLIYNFQLSAIIVLIAAAVFFIYRSFAYHRKKERRKQARIAFDTSNDRIVFSNLITSLSQRISGLLETLQKAYDSALRGLTREDRNALAEAAASIAILREQNEDLQYELFQSVKRIQESDSEGSRLLLYVFDIEQDIVQSVNLVAESCSNHVNNALKPLSPRQVQWLRSITGNVGNYMRSVNRYISCGEGDFDELMQHKTQVLQELEETLRLQVTGVKDSTYGARNSQLMFKLLLETKDMVAIAARFVKLQERLQKAERGDGAIFLSVSELEETD